jgi:hypothetical protein
MCRLTLFGYFRIATPQLPIWATVCLAGLMLACVSACPAVAQTVQLPTFSSFSVDTSVSIPDSDGAYSEAARRARQQPGFPGLKPAGADLGRQQSGRAGQGGRGAAGTTAGGSALSVHATIHDSPSDQSANRGRAARHADVTSGLDRFAIALAATRESTAGRPAPSVKQARRHWLAEKQKQAQQAARSAARSGRGAE